MDNRVTEKHETNRDRIYMAVSGEVETIKELKDFVAERPDLKATVVVDPMMFVIEELIADYQYNFMTAKQSDSIDVGDLTDYMYEKYDFINNEMFMEKMEEYLEVEEEDIM